MSKTLIFVAGAILVNGIAIAVPTGESKSARAVDTLVEQLQRRFHDRDNVVFGYGRIARDGRAHFTTVMDIRKGGTMPLRDDGKPMGFRFVNGVQEIELADGVWVSSQEYKDVMHPENDQERQAISALSAEDVAIYTAGSFDQTTGAPTHLMGPAYLRQITPKAPEKESIAKVASRAWAGNRDVTTLREGQWEYRIVKVRADDQSCVNCHTGRIGTQNIKNYALNNPIGVFIIGTKQGG